MRTPNEDDDLDDVYDAFIIEAIETGCVWGLESDEGWAISPSGYNDDLDVMPLWSRPELAEVHCKEEWAQYRVVPISVEELLDDWLPGMHTDVLFVGINWDEELEGEEVEPLDLLEDFDRVAADMEG